MAFLCCNVPYHHHKAKCKHGQISGSVGLMLNEMYQIVSVSKASDYRRGDVHNSANYIERLG
jgi:hypothetical protein